MADTTFQTTIPPVKAVDQGDGTYSKACVIYADSGIYTTFAKTFPPLRAVQIGVDADGNPIYARACVLQ